MFKKNNDKTNDNIINMYKSKLYGKYNILNEVLSRNEYIYKDVAIDEIDSSIVPSIQRREPDMNNVYDICFNTDNKMPFCKTLKEGFKSLDDIDTHVNNNQKKKDKPKQRMNNRNYYSEYYNNKF
jgi:hypothetical protein